MLDCWRSLCWACVPKFILLYVVLLAQNGGTMLVDYIVVKWLSRRPRPREVGMRVLYQIHDLILNWLLCGIWV